MNKVILIVFSGLLAVQLVSAQSHTTWAAAQVPGLEGVPVSLLAVPGNSPGLRVMYNALKTDKRILDLLKAGILAPLSNSILFVPGGKTMLQTTKTTVVETMTSESALQDKKSSDVENVKTNAPKENNVIIKPSTQNAGVNLNILGKRLKRVPELADMKLDIAVETNDLPVKKVKIPKRKKSISRKRSKNRVSKRRQSSRKMRPVTRPFKTPDVQPFQKPMEKVGTISSQRRPIYNQYIEKPSKIVRTDIVQEASVPRVVNVALDYDSKALTDTLLVMLKTMHMIQKYIKDSLTTTTTTTTPSTTTTPTTTTTTKTTTTTRPTTTLPYYRILSTVPKTTPTTTTPSPITEATTTEFYMADMTTTDFETTTEDYALVDSSANNKANSELAPDVVDFIQAFKKAIKLAKKKPEKPKKPQGADKLTQLHKLLEGISPSQLQTLVDLIKAKANEGKPKPLPKPEPLPKPKPIFAPPPPPGSEHKGPPREFRSQMPSSRSGPYRPNSDYGPPPDNRGPPPDWARGPGGRPRGPPGPPGPGGPGGPGMRGGPDLSNPQIARLIRVMKQGGHPKNNFLSGRTPGSSAAAAGGEAPEAGEGPTGLLGNPLMMSMLMNRGGQGGGGGIASLLGGGAAGGANPLAALMPGGAGGAGGGGNPLSMLQGLGGLPGSGGAGASSEGGMNPAMLAAIMGGGQGGGGGLGALGSLLGGGNAGGLGGLGAAMMHPDGPDFPTSGGPTMTALLSAAASGQTPSNSADPQPTAGASMSSPATSAAAYPSKSSEANAAIKDALNLINSGQTLNTNTVQKTAEPKATLTINPTPMKPKKRVGKGKRQQRLGTKKSKAIKPPSQILDPYYGPKEKKSGTNNLHGQQNSWKPNPFHIPSIQTNSNDQQQPRNAPKWQQKRRNMFNSRRKQQQFQRKQERMDVKGPGKNRQSVSPGSLSTTDVLGKFKPTQQTWQITKGQPKMPRRNNNRGISVGFPQPNKKPNRPNRPNNRGQGKKPQGPKGGGQTIGDMIQNMFKGGAPPGAAGGMPNMPGPLAGGGDAAGLGALLGLGESGGMPMMPPGQSGAGGLEALLAMGGGSGQGAGGGEGLGGLGALMGLGGAGGSGSNPLEALLGAGGRGPGSNPLEALMGAGGAGAGGNPLEALLGPGGTGTGSNPLEALMGAGGAGAGGNPLEALLGPGGAGGGSNPLDALLGAGGAASSNALGAFFGKEKPGKKGKPGRGRPPFGKPFRPPKGGPGSMFPFLGRNPMGPGRPLIPGMTPGQVSDLMGGRPGPVPMDIAHQADLMSKMGHTVDHIVDVLGDVLQHRRSMPGYAAAALAAGSFPGMGIGNAGGPGKPGRKQGRHV